jgi:hypothetical protein
MLRQRTSPEAHCSWPALMLSRDLHRTSGTKVTIQDCAAVSDQFTDTSIAMLSPAAKHEVATGWSSQHATS